MNFYFLSAFLELKNNIKTSKIYFTVHLNKRCDIRWLNIEMAYLNIFSCYKKEQN